MATLAEFLKRLFGEGRVVFDSPPTPDSSDSERERAEAVDLLRLAFDADLMELAGPPLSFDKTAALAASEWTRRACWFLVSRGEPPEVVDRALKLPPFSKSAAAHLSADLIFRYLPAVYRRARAIDPDDVLSRKLVELLRRWPLSGVLADLDATPTTPIDFQGHEGLMLRFAERLAGRESSTWAPSDGRGKELLDLVQDANSPRSLRHSGREGADHGRG